MENESDNVKIFVEYTDRVKNGDTGAVYEFFGPEFFSHVVRRVAP